MCFTALIDKIPELSALFVWMQVRPCCFMKLLLKNNYFKVQWTCKNKVSGRNYDFLAYSVWKNSAILNHFQGGPCKGVFVVMKGLWVWAIACTYTAIHWDNEQNPNLSAVWRPGQCCKLTKPFFEISVRRKSVFQRAWKHFCYLHFYLIRWKK